MSFTVITICDKKTGKEAYLHRLVGRLFVSTWMRWTISLTVYRNIGCGLRCSLHWRMARLREYRLQMRRLEKMLLAVWQDRTQNDQDGHRTTSVRLVCVQAATWRLPGRCQLHGVLSHSSTRPSDLHVMQPVSDPALNSSSMTDVACL